MSSTERSDAGFRHRLRDHVERPDDLGTIARWDSSTFTEASNSGRSRTSRPVRLREVSGNTNAWEGRTPFVGAWELAERSPIFRRLHGSVTVVALRAGTASPYGYRSGDWRVGRA